MAEIEPEPRVSRAERVSMIDMKEPHILVLTTDEQYAQRIRGGISLQPFGTTFITRTAGFETALQSLRSIDIALVDVASLGGDWPCLLRQIVTRFQQASYVAVIETDQYWLVDDLFAYGVADCIEKEATSKMMQMRIGNILRLRQLEQDNQKLRREQREKSQEMIDLQRVMATMERSAERAAKEVEYRIFTQIRSLVMPLFEEIAGQAYGQVSEEPLNALKKYVNDLASGLASHLQGNTSLSAQELRVALMVKNGMTSEEIAAHLHVSPETIKTHRRNIRRKFGLTSSNQKLSVYLQSLRPLEAPGAGGSEIEVAPEGDN
ncbi:helix-turn-helix domain-containing protein [Candidatus Entotheonella palauensis]|nr:helix-turn-helix transcriptional regulator [Candidatus Entotheonella palauensis]